jgi:lysine 2,3-aminomutase
MVDVPGGKGKVPILPDDVKREGRTWLSGSYLREVVEYSDGD